MEESETHPPGAAIPQVAVASEATDGSFEAVLLRRLAEGQGECLWDIGLGPDGATVAGHTEEGYATALEELTAVARTNACDVTEIMQRPCPRDAALRCGIALVRRLPSESDFMELRVAVCGNVDSGKSTFVGVLGNGVLDNGRGSAREAVCNHHHELTSGRTSSVSQQMIGFDSKGVILSYTALPRDEIAARSAKIVTLYDLAGHEKYLKTTVHSITGSVPDYAFVIVSANNSVQRMTKEHLGLCLALKVPLVFIITRIDATPPNVFKETVQTVQKLLKQAGVRKMPYMVHTLDDVLICARHVKLDRVVPIFCVSNVTGEGLDNVRAFLNVCPMRRDWASARDAPAEVVLENTFYINGVGTVVSGIVTQGTIRSGDTMTIGPDGNGAFRPVVIKSIQCKGVTLPSAHAGNCAGFALKKEKRSAIRKGMVLLDSKVKPMAVWQFEAEVLVLYHSTTIKVNYQPVVHCRTVRQSARILKMEGPAEVPADGEEACIRTGDKALVTFRFLYHAEYVLPGMRLVFREGRTKGIGTVTRVDGDAMPVPDTH